MSLARYFFYVGGVLLALLFVADAFLPKLPIAHGGGTHSAVIRIHSDRKWPERIVFDTNLPTIIPAQIANTEANSAAPATVGPAKARELEAFAQLQPSDAKQLQRSDPEKREPKLQRQRKIAKHAASRTRLVARQPQLGWFGYGIW
jgi:hypothetical protein